jgi:UDP-GlcNAc3NAcA epimerase
MPRPDYNLGVGGGSHGENTGQMLQKIEEVLEKEKPNCLLVYGDTDSTLAGALAAAKLHIPVVHVEAGLRSYNRKMPEEINRVLVDHLSDLLLTPTTVATKNLEKEGINGEDVKQVGDVMYDAALHYLSKSERPGGLKITENFILTTIHRAENTDDPLRLKNIFSALNELAKTVRVVIPIHPRTTKKIQESDIDTSNLILLDPVGYFQMIWLLQNCEAVITDSGGLQKEAFYFEKKCLTIRDETEWVELISIGANVLVGADKDLILSESSNLSFPELKKSKDLYGVGKSGELIAQIVLHRYKEKASL